MHFHINVNTNSNVTICCIPWRFIKRKINPQTKLSASTGEAETARHEIFISLLPNESARHFSAAPPTTCPPAPQEAATGMRTHSRSGPEEQAWARGASQAGFLIRARLGALASSPSAAAPGHVQNAVLSRVLTKILLVTMI